MTAFTHALWLFALIPLALVVIVCFLYCNAKNHVVIDEPEEQKEMTQRFREAGG